MATKKKFWIYCGSILAGIVCCILGVWLYFANDPWGFSRIVSPQEAALRLQVVETAEKYLGYNELDGSHKAIVDLYNSHKPLAMDYEVTYTDSWCSTFASAVAIELELTDIIPTECGCERQIGLFQELDCWQESDSYLPLPGDLIFYAWDEKFSFRDCTGWADHVGIVVGTAGPFLKVIEGNKDDAVSYRYIIRNHPEIRGFGLPDYASLYS